MISKEYKYHPENKELLRLCKLFEEQLPDAKFSHKYVKEWISQKIFLRIEAQYGNNYYCQLLRDSQTPEQIVETFKKKLGKTNIIIARTS